MLKLLLVDDEYLELNMLAENIDWHALGFTLVALAKNGQDAWEKAEEHLPDVVITDIKMPIMDGVMLAQKLYKKYPRTKVVFLSGYNQYEYMRSAMEVQALDYLLKPLDLDEIPPLMKKVQERCLEDLKREEKEKTSAVQKVSSVVLLGKKPENEDEFARQCCICLNKPYFYENIFYMAVAVLGEYTYWVDNEEEGPQIISRCHQYILQFAKEHKADALPIRDSAYLLLSTHPILPPTRDWMEEDRGLWTIICCKKEAVRAGDIPEAYAHLDSLRHWWVTHCPTKPIMYEEEMEQKAGQTLPLQRLPDLDTYLLLQYLREGNEEKTNAWVLEYYEQNEEGSNILTVNLFDFLYESLITPSKHLRKKMTSKAEIYVKLFKIESADVLAGEVCHYLKQLMEQLQKSKSDPAEMIISHVRAFIETNYAQSLSIDTLAEKFYFSGNYLRSMFKRYTGTTVLEYITEVRLQRAEFLLRTTPMTVTNISTEVGYSNPSYFCLLFSKKYGITPNEYRNRVR